MANDGIAIGLGISHIFDQGAGGGNPSVGERIFLAGSPAGDFLQLAGAAGLVLQAQ